MLGLILIYFIGKKFYQLAEEFNQNKWLFAILSIVSYYFGSIIIGGVILGFADELIGLGINWDNNLGIGIMVLPFGLGTAYLFYYLLKKKWEKSVILIKDEIKDIGKNIEENN